MLHSAHIGINLTAKNIAKAPHFILEATVFASAFAWLQNFLNNSRFGAPAIGGGANIPIFSVT